MNISRKSTANDDEQRFAGEIRADKLQLLYRQSLPAVFLSLIGALMLTAILWSHADHGALLGWLVALTIASALRVGLFASYRRAAPRGADFLAWERPYFVTLMISSLVWGLGTLWVMPKEEPVYQAIVYYFLMGMAGGAISVYAATRLFTIAAILAVLLPVTLWMLWQGGHDQVLMGVAAFLLITAAVRSSRVMSGALHRTFQLTHELQAAKDEAERLARTDALTGLNNRRAFVELAEVSLSYCQRNQLPVSTLILDIDHFKRINDSHGHSVGDQVLREVAQVLAGAIRRSDICARTGGEEFAVLLPDTPLAEAAKVAEKVRLAIAAHVTHSQGGEIRVTASCGVASGNESLDALLQQADAAMYQAKEAGRDRVICWPAKRPGTDRSQA